MGKRPRGRGRVLGELMDIGRVLSGERTLDGLLHAILLQARRLTSAEAGTLFLPDGDSLRFAVVQNDALVARLGAAETTRRLQAERLALTQGSLAGHVALTGEVLNIPDVYQLPADGPFAFAAQVDRRTGYRTRSVLAVPLEDPSGELLGVLELINAMDEAGEVVAFSATDERLVRFLASYAAVVLRNAQLYQRAEARAGKLATLTRLTRLMLAVRDPEAVFREISRAAVTLLGAKAARLWIDDPEARLLRTQGGFGIDPDLERPLTEFPTLPYGWGAVGRVFESRTPLYIENVLDDERWVNRRLAAEAGLHTFAGIPLSTADRPLGVLAVFFGERRRLTVEEQELLGLLADHAALVVETAQLSRARELRASRLGTLTRLNQLISSSLSTADILRTLTHSAAELMSSPFVWIWMADPQAGTVTRVATSDEEIAARYPASVRRIGEGLVGWVAQHREPAVVPDITRDERITERSWLEQHGFRSALALPITIGEDLLGVLALVGTEPWALDPDRQQLLDSLVAQAAIALRNARLYEELRVAHEQLAHSQTQLIHNEKLAALGQFVAGVAHELNNPLAAVLGHTYLADQTADLVRLKDQVRKIQISAERAANIVRTLLQFARKSAPSHEPVDVNALIERALEITADKLTSSRTVVIRDLAPVLAITAGNAAELQQVVVNLVMNACQAMEDTGGTLTIRSRAVDAAIQIDVSDTGPGIPPSIRLKIFDPFFTTKPVGVGTGLGLSVAAGIVTAHGGRLWLEDEPSNGTTFRIELPVRHAAATAPATALSPLPPGRRILVVDDEPSIAEALADLLRELGCEVVVAPSAKIARDVLAREAFDLISLDLIMPEESGFDFWRELRETKPELAAKVVFISGAADPALLRFVDATSRPVLAKPFTLATLRTLLAAQFRP